MFISSREWDMDISEVLLLSLLQRKVNERKSKRGREFSSIGVIIIISLVVVVVIIIHSFSKYLFEPLNHIK